MDAGRPNVKNLISQFENINAQSKSTTKPSSSAVSSKAQDIDGVSREVFKEAFNVGKNAFKTKEERITASVNELLIFDEQNSIPEKEDGLEEGFNYPDLDKELNLSESPKTAPKVEKPSSEDELIKKFANEKSKPKEVKLTPSQQRSRLESETVDTQVKGFKPALKDLDIVENKPYSDHSDNIHLVDDKTKFSSQMKKEMDSHKFPSSAGGNKIDEKESLESENGENVDQVGIDSKESFEDQLNQLAEIDSEYDIEEKLGDYEMSEEVNEASDLEADEDVNNILNGPPLEDVDADAYEELDQVQKDIKNERFNDVFAEMGWSETSNSDVDTPPDDVGISQNKQTSTWKDGVMPKQPDRGVNESPPISEAGDTSVEDGHTNYDEFNALVDEFEKNKSTEKPTVSVKPPNVENSGKTVENLGTSKTWSEVKQSRVDKQKDLSAESNVQKAQQAAKKTKTIWSRIKSSLPSLAGNMKRHYYKISNTL